MGEKFRPRQISDVVGQDTVKNVVRRSLRNKTFPQFSLMYGPSGTGKSTMAEICGLSITCESPENGEPCCRCKSCVDNLKLLNDGKSSYNISKLNMGAIERSDFKATIRDVFTLKPAIGDNAVYIFEEIQALTKDEQNILLEYISNIASNIYVIACTTEMNRLRQELRNRAIKFAFKQIKTDEAIGLLSRVCSIKGITTPTADIAKFLVRSAHNCPREIVNLIDFLADASSLDADTLSQFLGYVGNGVYVEYFQKCSEDTFDFVQWLDSKVDTGYENILRGLRDFVIDCYGYVFGSNTAYFNTHEKHNVKLIFEKFNEERMLELMRFFDECRWDNETSAKYCLISGRRFFLGKDNNRVMRESRHDASRSVMKSESATRSAVKENAKVQKISDSDLDNILGTMQRIKPAVTSDSKLAESTTLRLDDEAIDVKEESVVDMSAFDEELKLDD